MGAAIIGLGMVTACGFGARATAAAVRARLSRVAESLVVGLDGEPLKMGLVPVDQLPPVPEQHPGLSWRQRRMVRLAAPALLEALQGISDPAGDPLPLFLGVPEDRPELAPLTWDAFLAELSAHGGGAIDPSASQVFARGRASGLLALDAALQHLHRQRRGRALVGGVDSYLDAVLLEQLQREGRLLCAEHSDAFVPGEGAAFLLLQAGGGEAPVAEIVAVATGTEAGHRYAEAPFRGDGLAQTFQRLFSAVPGSAAAVGSVYAGLNGERLGAKEWGVAYLRSARRFAEGHGLEHPVQSLGDPGAALGPLLIGLAALALRSGYRRGPSLVWCSSDREERGAALLHAPAVSA